VESRTVAIVVLVGAGGYYLTRRDPITGRSVLDDWQRSTNAFGSRAETPTARTDPWLVPGYTTTTTASGSQVGSIIGAGGAAAGAILPSLIGTGSATAGAGIGLGAALAATGIAAGAAVLIWGIIQRGWFRGGEEAIYVNPLRDQYFDYFIKSSSYANTPTYGKTVVLGATSIQTVRYNAFLEVARRAHVPEDQIDRILTQLYRADSKDEIGAAMAEVENTFRQYETAAVVAGLGF
jgi:hypothetical protein